MHFSAQGSRKSILIIMPKQKGNWKVFNSVPKLHTDSLTCWHGTERKHEKNPNEEPTVNVFLAYGAPGVRSSSEVTGLFNTVRQTQGQGENPSGHLFIHVADIYWMPRMWPSTNKHGKDPHLTVYLSSQTETENMSRTINPKPNLETSGKKKWRRRALIFFYQEKVS